MKLKAGKLSAAILIVALLVAAFRPAPLADEGLMQRIVRQVGEYYAARHAEKAYLHLDKPVYATGETLWFSAYVVGAQRHQPDSLSRVLHVELLSPERLVVLRRTLELRGGFGYGDVFLPDTLPAGTYLLRAYTNWMRNAGDEFLYSRRLSVWSASPFAPQENTPAAGKRAAGKAAAAKAAASAQPDVQFFPEGGALIETLPAVVGCKATDASGRGLDVSGQVLDAQNNPVAEFSTRHRGMGRFAFTPAPGQRYLARVRLPGGRTADYPLPAPQPTGYSLHVTDAGNAYLVEARYHGAPGQAAPGPALLLAEVRGFLAYPGARPIAAAAPATWRVAKAPFPDGILHLTLFDAQGTPQAERLAFVLNGPAALQVALVPDRASYGPRQPVRLAVKVTGADGKPTAARLSVAVTEAGVSALDPNAETIASNLLLTSDLAGYVEDPGYYFRDDAPGTRQALDDLLLTQGWRRFVWKDVLAGQAPAAAYKPEQAISLSGQVVNYRGNKPVGNSQLTAMLYKPDRQLLSGTTTDDGRFQFNGFSETDTTVISLWANRAKGQANVLIRPDNGPAAPRQPMPALPSVAPEPVASYVLRSRQQQLAEQQLHPETMRGILLANVTVTGKRLLVPPDDRRRIFGTPIGARVVDYANDPSMQTGTPVLEMLQGRVPNLGMSNGPAGQTIQLQGSTLGPVYYIDGVKLDNSFAMDRLMNLPSDDVETVEVYKGAEAAIFGGSGGAIVIYTKSGDPNYKGPLPTDPINRLVLRVPGFYRAQEFYVPRYDAPATSVAPDPRHLTLYWNPTVQTDANGEAELRFFTADGSGPFQAVAEGITPAGQPARGVGRMVVQGK